MRTIALLSLTTASMIIACVQEPPSDLPPDEVSTAKQYFNEHIMPLLEGRCMNCHANPADAAPDYLGTSKDRFYDELVKNPLMVSCNVGNSMLLAKGFDPGHPGGDLSAQERDEVETWLSIEAQDRFGGKCDGTHNTDPSGGAGTGGVGGAGGAGPVAPSQLTGQDAMKQFGECMTLEEWKSTGMYLVANQPCTYLDNDNNQCKGCHNSGQGSNWMNEPGDDTKVASDFEKMRYAYGSFNLIRWTVNLEDGSFKDIVPSYRWRDKGKDIKSNHPTYELTPENLAALDNWFNLTYEKWKNGPCTP